jgi:hypothetical protein
MRHQNRNRGAWLKSLHSLFLLLPLTINAAETNPKDATPGSIKPILATYETETGKAFNAYQEAVAKALDKATKDMDSKLKEAMKKGDLEGATAIKVKLDSISKGELLSQLEEKWKNEDLLGGEKKPDSNNVIVGKWGDGNILLWEFKPDKTGFHYWSGVAYTLKWASTKDSEYTVFINGPGPVRPLKVIDKNTINIEPGNSIRMK